MQILRIGYGIRGFATVCNKKGDASQKPGVLGFFYYFPILLYKKRFADCHSDFIVINYNDYCKIIQYKKGSRSLLVRELDILLKNQILGSFFIECPR
jgi:hypothetical protein